MPKRITIRVSPELHKQLVQIGTDQEKSLNTLAVEALEYYAIQAGRFPLQKLSDILAPAAEAGEISEEELLEHARSVRQRIWKERYEKSVHAASL
ncbi:MAG: toxin-antitoxin system HicB family antitoxin [Chloroflexi bacterium]|nr:toxin-antitoxin system HicB family antitoxin [Chloroflexota bacterium]